MFTQSIFLVLLGSTFVLANPIEFQVVEDAEFNNELFEIVKNFEDVEDQGRSVITEIIKEKLNQLEKKIDELAEQAKAAIEEQKKIWEAKIEEARKIGQQQYEEILKQAKEALNQMEKVYKAKIDELQKKLKELIEKLKEIGGISI